MHNNSINKLLNLKEVQVKNITHSDSSVTIYISSKAKPHLCPSCNLLTSRVHDYRNQAIKDLPIMMKKTFIVLKKRRYSCKCGKRFYESYDFLPKYHRMTNRFVAYICRALEDTVSAKHVAKQLNISSHTVFRVFNHINYPKLSSLPEVLSIDEFRGNAETAKYQCILVDGKKNKVLDILPDRKQAHLIEYFKNIPRYQRHKVKFFVCDMWKPYIEIAKIFFPNAKIIIDKYHFIRQITWAIENIRKRIQKEMRSDVRKYFKRSRKLILSRNNKLDSEGIERLNTMLLYNDDLRQAYRLKEEFYNLCQSSKYSEQRVAFANWIKYAEAINIPEFKNCINTFTRWKKEILNAFKYGYTNGPTEGFNNKIKVLKRVSYGLKNFYRYRNRILHIC